MFDKVVFAGGGHQCWWQAGFWEHVSGEIELHPRVIGAVSAGAVTACLLYATDTRRALAWYERELKGVRRNINWLNLVRSGQPLMPHAAILRKALRALLGGESFRQLMWRAPEIRVQYARLPHRMSPMQAGIGCMLATRLEDWRASPLTTSGQRLGLVRDVKRVQDCRSERELVDLLVAASSMPPFAPIELIDGEPSVDGELIDRNPVATVADVPGQTLVLAPRRYPSLAPVFARDGLLYVQPSEKLAVSGWDYTSAARFQKTFDQGRRDGEAFLKTFVLGRHADESLSASPLLPGARILAAPVVVAATASEHAAGGSGANGAGEVPETDRAGDAEAEVENAGNSVLDVSAKLANYREPTEAGIAEDLSESQPAASAGHVRSGRSLRASNI